MATIIILHIFDIVLSAFGAWFVFAYCIKPKWPWHRVEMTYAFAFLVAIAVLMPAHLYCTLRDRAAKPADVTSIEGTPRTPSTPAPPKRR